MRPRGPQTKQRTPLKRGRPLTHSIIQWAGLTRSVSLGVIVLLAFAELWSLRSTHNTSESFRIQ